MKLALGTVQFGLNYGVTNTLGQVQQAEVSSILSQASKYGITVLDTACSYGNSETVLGENNTNKFNIITKVPHLGDYSLGMLSSYADLSIKKTKHSVLDGLLLHNESDLLGPYGKDIFSELSSLKENGKVNKIGVSFYNADIAKKTLDKFDVDLIQVPASCLDQRFELSGLLELAKEKEIEIHARSLFLQGLLITSEENRPNQFKKNKDLIRFDDYAKSISLSQIELAVSYLANNKLIDFGVIGCLKASQLIEVVDAYSRVINHCSIDHEQLESDNISLINPSLWK